MTTTNGKHATQQAHRPRLPHAIRLLAVPIVLAWVAITVLVNMIAPQLEAVSELHSAPMAPMDAPSMQAMLKMGGNFHEFSSNSTVMVVLEGQKELGDDAHQYYSNIIGQLEQRSRAYPAHSGLLGRSANGGGSSERRLKGRLCDGVSGRQSGHDVGERIRRGGPQGRRLDAGPPGVKAYVTGPAATADDLHVIGNASIGMITVFTLGAIAIMLLIVYRSIVTTLVQLFLTGVGLASARGVVAVLGNHNVFGLTTFASNILTMLGIAAATDYGIFIFGRYREARQAGEDPQTAYYTTFRSVAPVIVGSGLTIAGATYCLSFCRLPYFSTMGAPVAIGMLVVVASAITLGPAVLFLGSRIGLFEAKRAQTGRFWRRVGIAVVRWPAPIMVTSAVIVLIGMVAIPGFRPGYNDRYYLPDSAPANVGYAASDRHFSQARMNPDILMIEADHDMRNPADMLVLDRVARNILNVVGIAMVQDITRPLGIPIQHSSIPFQNSMQGQTSNQNLPFMKGAMANMLKMSDEMGLMVNNMEKLYGVMQELAATTHHTAEDTKQLQTPHR